MPNKYTPIIPRQQGIHIIENIPIETLVPYIDWRFFFVAWKISGNYAGIETLCDCAACTETWLRNFPAESREKAAEALSLYKDAVAMLRQMRDEKMLHAKGIVGLFEAVSADESLVFTAIDGQKAVLPMLRQQESVRDGVYYSLADFVSPIRDYAGTFAVCVHGAEAMAQAFEAAGDTYNAILAKTLADRLAEAAAEWLHEQIRKHYWGYAATETLSIDDMLRVRYTGIRPAVGYPSLPDQSLIFELTPLLPSEKIGITLTENGAMLPNASVCGIVISHPKAKYFAVGRIDEAQLQDYARRRGKSVADMRRWLLHNVN